MNDPSAESERTAKTRKKIQIAARRLFLQNGFHATSTDAIVVAAGIASKETLYRYYRKKDELFIDVIRSVTIDRPSLKPLFEPPALPESHNALRAILVARLSGVIQTMMQPDYLALMRITLSELPRFPQLGGLFREAIPAQAMKQLERFLRAGQAAGLIRAEAEPSLVGRMLIGTLLTFAIFDGMLVTDRRGHIRSARIPGPDVIESIAESILDGVSVRRPEKEKE